MISAVLLAAALILFEQSGAMPPRRMDRAGAEKLIADGRAAMERRDVDSIMALMSPKAMVFGQDVDGLRKLLQGAVNQVHGKLIFDSRNVQIQQMGDTAELTFDIDLKQNSNEMSAVYFKNHHFTVRLERITTSRLFGLYKTSEWLVTNIESEPPIEITPS